MMALTFSPIADIASSIAWQLTLSLMHILWVGTAIIVFAAIVDRALAQRLPTSTDSVDHSHNAQTRYWVNLVALLLVGVALPCTFAVVRNSESEVDQRNSHNAQATDGRLLTDATVLATNMEKVPEQLLASDSQDDAVKSTVSTEISAEAEQSILAIVSGRARIAAPFVALIYLAGVMLMFARLAAAICGGQRLTSLGQPVVEQSVLEVLAAQAERLALKAAPGLAYCERVAVPVVVGVLKPVILLPAAMTSGLSSQELAAVLAHELAHVKRFDHVLIVVQRFLEALLFFHPAVWWLSRRINDSREHACDDLVIKGGTDRLDYARSLLRVAELRVGDGARAGQLAQLAVDGGDPSKLRKRIERIVQSGDEPGVRLNQSRATFAFFVTALAIAISIVPVIPTVSENSVDAAATPMDQAAKQPTDDSSAGEASSESQSALQKKLEAKAELHVEKMPLIQVLDAVEKLSGVPVTVDLGDLMMRGVDPQMPMTLDVEDVTVQVLFDQIVQQAHLTFEIQSAGVLIPANTPAFELRIVPELPDSEAKIRVPEGWDKSHYRDGTIQGMGPAKDKGFAWFPVQKKAQGTVNIPVSGVNGTFQIGLLSDTPNHVLTADGSWHVQEVKIQDDDFGQRNVRVKLDQLGGLHLQRLSKTSMNQQLAIIVNGVVISAPIVRSEIGREFVITGNFSDDELTMIADGIRGAMVPPGKELTYKCDVMDEKSGEPVSGAKVLWRVRRTSFKQDERPLFEQRFTTDKNGRYTVQLPREAFEFAQLSIEFEVQHPDYLPKKNVGTRLTLPNARKPAWSDLRHLRIRRGVPVTGRFVNPDGTPAANLPIMVSRSRDAPGAGFRGDVVGRTDEEGRYRIITTPNWPKRLHWFPKNFVADSVALQKATDAPQPITFGEQKTIRLKNGPRLSGRVVDRAGSGLSGIYVEAFTGRTVPVLHAKSGPDGRFKFTPSPPGEYNVYTMDGFLDPITEKYLGNTLTRPFNRVTATLPKSGEPKPVTIQQAPSDAITVTAFDEDGEPAINTSFWTGSEPYRSATSEPIKGQPGKYRLWIRRGRNGGSLTTNRSYETATVWQRTAQSSPVPGESLDLGKVKRKGEEVIVRFRKSGTIRLVVKAGDKIVPWDARNLNIKYARASDFEKLGVRDPGFAITVPKQGPEHVIQRVAPDEDVIIDVGIKGELRKQHTVRVGAGETKTITIDLASTETAATSGNDSKPVQPEFAALSVKYDVEGSDDEAKIILQHIGVPNGEIGSVQRGMMRHTPVKKGESFQLNKLVPGKYQVARYREVEIITLVGKENDPKGPRVNSGVYIDRMQFSLNTGESRSIVFQRPKGQRVKGQITNLAEFKPNRTVVEICSPNAKDDDIGRGLEVTVFDAQQCNDGKFETDPLAPGKYKAIVTAYDAWTEGQMFSSGVPRPHFVGSTDFTVPPTGKAEPIEAELRDILKKTD